MIVVRRHVGQRRAALRGGRRLRREANGEARAVLLATGSEVSVALAARDALQGDDVPTSVVSLPSWELFEQQDESYRDKVLPPNVEKRLAVEAGSSFGWSRYIGLSGEVISIDRYGASAPGGTNMEKFGFTPDNVEKRARALLAT